jgi:predicted ribonuclease YlaK
MSNEKMAKVFSLQEIDKIVNITEKTGNMVIPDKTTFEYNPHAAEILSEKGANTVYITMPTIIGLQKDMNKVDVGVDAAEALRIIEKRIHGGDKSIVIVKDYANVTWADKRDLDHMHLAAVKATIKNYHKRHLKAKIISQDPGLRLLMSETANKDVLIQNFEHDNAIEEFKEQIKEITVAPEAIDNGCFPYTKDMSNEEIIENEGVICSCEEPYPGWEKKFPAMRKGDLFRIIPSDITAFSLRPKSINGKINYSQYIGLAQLLDPAIRLVILVGSAGTGKTILAFAAGHQQRDYYQKIIITRPFIYVEDEDKMGALPGQATDKLQFINGPAREHNQELEKINPDRTISNDIEEIEKKLESNNFTQKEKYKLEKKLKKLKATVKFKQKNTISKDIGPYMGNLEQNGQLEYRYLGGMRGATINGYIIGDDFQNATPHQVKTLLTRSGECAKFILTGDTAQIDNKLLDSRSNGIANAIYRLKGHPWVAITTFREEDTVRSLFAKLVAERM